MADLSETSDTPKLVWLKPDRVKGAEPIKRRRPKGGQEIPVEPPPPPRRPTPRGVVPAVPEARPDKVYWLDTCPLCKGEARMVKDGNGLYPDYTVSCRKCHCSTQSYKDPYWAAKRWNTRAAPNMDGVDVTGEDEDGFPLDPPEYSDELAHAPVAAAVSAVTDVERPFQPEPDMTEPEPAPETAQETAQEPAPDVKVEIKVEVRSIGGATGLEPIIVRSRRVRRKYDGAGQMVFDFMTAAEETATHDS